MKIEELTNIIARYDPSLGKCGQPNGKVRFRPLPVRLSEQGTDGGGQCLPPFSRCGR